MSAEPNHEEINRKEATQADTAVPEISVPGSDECSMDSSSDSMTTGTADSTSLATTSLVDSEKMCNDAKRGEEDAVKKPIKVEDKNIKPQVKLNGMEQCGGLATLWL
ncbi:Protein of unknown function [Pyronema omphalodes CBS 100304]|uniref:Uncharacterized protein n=1 Tax=Pyronema omphalodes (strain CBS 100304) TaxID=1076935 RepID=U4LVN8_PYROM|nr:Protein of unknown function [Pyronema omphalodes CBS 100304]